MGQGVWLLRGRSAIQAIMPLSSSKLRQRDAMLHPADGRAPARSKATSRRQHYPRPTTPLRGSMLFRGKMQRGATNRRFGNQTCGRAPSARYRPLRRPGPHPRSLDG
jgi:hypothetical protein